MKKQVVKVIITKNIDYEIMYELYKENGWIKPEKKINFSLMKKIVDNSFCFAGAYLDNKLIGMGRVLSDGVSDAYIQDVTILKKFRAQGIGGKIISTIIKYLKQKKLAGFRLLQNLKRMVFIINWDSR